MLKTKYQEVTTEYAMKYLDRILRLEGMLRQNVEVANNKLKP